MKMQSDHKANNIIFHVVTPDTVERKKTDCSLLIIDLFLGQTNVLFQSVLDSNKKSPTGYWAKHVYPGQEDLNVNPIFATYERCSLRKII